MSAVTHPNISIREQSAEKELSASENELVTAAKRLRQLDAQKKHLHGVLEVLKQK
jgi:hypothetical protein